MPINIELRDSLVAFPWPRGPQFTELKGELLYARNSIRLFRLVLHGERLLNAHINQVLEQFNPRSSFGNQQGLIHNVLNRAVVIRQLDFLLCRQLNIFLHELAQENPEKTAVLQALFNKISVELPEGSGERKIHFMGQLLLHFKMSLLKLLYFEHNDNEQIRLIHKLNDAFGDNYRLFLESDYTVNSISDLAPKAIPFNRMGNTRGAFATPNHPRQLQSVQLSPHMRALIARNAQLMNWPEGSIEKIYQFAKNIEPAEGCSSRIAFGFGRSQIAANREGAFLQATINLRSDTPVVATGNIIDLRNIEHIPNPPQIVNDTAINDIRQLLTQWRNYYNNLSGRSNVLESSGVPVALFELDANIDFNIRTQEAFINDLIGQENIGQNSIRVQAALLQIRQQFVIYRGRLEDAESLRFETYRIESLNNLSYGAILLNPHGQLSYFPAQAVVLHELLHVLHNSRGVNRRHLTNGDGEMVLRAIAPQYHSSTVGGFEEFYSLLLAKVSEYNGIERMGMTCRIVYSQGLLPLAMFQLPPELLGALNELRAPIQDLAQERLPASLKPGASSFRVFLQMRH